MLLRQFIIFFMLLNVETCFATKSSIVLSVPFAPAPVSIFGNKKALVYELTIENLANETITPLAIDVNSNKKTLIEYSGKELDNNLEYPNKRNTIAPGQKATLFIWVAFPSNQNLPNKLTHQMAYSANGIVKLTPIEATINIQQNKAINLSPPLSGGPWLATGISNYTQHRRATITYNDSSPLLPERYAIDWTKFDNIEPNGSDHHGDGSQNTDYYAYGQSVLASSNGIVVAVRNALPDNPNPPTEPKLHDELDRPGNYIVIKTIDNNYLVYCHLQPNILVTKGQEVVRGELIGYVGSSGNAGIPHLHFDVVNADNQTSPFLAEGLPYIYKNFRFLGLSQADPQFYLNPFAPSITHPTRLKNQLPLNGMFVQFE